MNYERMCYTVFALSDLVVSGVLPSLKATQPCTDFPKPLQRALKSAGDSAPGLRKDQ